MASAPTMYFAGIATVVAALGIGFGSATLLTSTTEPVKKEPAAAFAKREQPVVVETTGSVPPTITATAAPEPAAAPQTALTPPVPSAAEKVMALDYAPPIRQPSQVPTAAVAPTPTPQAAPAPVIAQPKSIISEKKDSVAVSRQKREKTPKVEQKESPPEVGEKKKPPTEFAKPEKKKTIVVERKRRPPPAVEDDDDDAPRMSFASGRTALDTRPRDFFSSLFGN